MDYVSLVLTFWKPEGCKNGSDCEFCHVCPSGELKARQKAKANATMVAKSQDSKRKQQRQDFSVGEKVRMRQCRQRWHDGMVTSISPLKVRFLDADKGCTWDQVQKVQPDAFSAVELHLESFLLLAAPTMLIESALPLSLMLAAPPGL